MAEVVRPPAINYLKDARKQPTIRLPIEMVDRGNTIYSPLAGGTAMATIALPNIGTDCLRKQQFA